MPWNSGITEALQKRIARYVIKHYLGRFIDHPISLDDLTFELVNGRIELTKLDLDVITLNKELDEHKVPFEIVEAYIDQIVVILPWRTLLADCTSVTVHGLELRLQPKKRSENGGMAFDSMLFNSMTKSMQLAREVMQQGILDPKTTDDGIQCMGMQDLANTIDKVLSKIQVQLFDTIIRLEHMAKDATVGTALEIKIARVEYFGDVENEERGGHEPEVSLDDTKPVYEKDAVTIKNIRLTKVSVFCDEIKSENRPTQRMQDSSMHRMDSFTESPEFTNMVSSHQPVVTDQPTSNGQIFGPEEEETSLKNIEPVLIMELGDVVNIKIKLRRIDSYPGAKLEMECRFGTVNVFLTPRLLHILTQIADGIVSPGLSEGRSVPKSMHKRMGVEDFQRVEQELQRHLPKHNGAPSIVSVRQHLPSTSDDGLMNQTIDDDNEYENDDIFMSLAANSMESSAASSVSGISNGTHRKRQPTASNKSTSNKSKGLTEDQADDTKRMKLRVSFLAITILHEDPAVTPNDLSRSSSVMDKLREMSDKYFSQVRLISAMGVKTAKDLVALRDDYSAACQCDHLGLLIHPLAIELTQQSLSFATVTAAELSINRMEIVDAVFNHHASTASIMGFHLPIQNVLPDYCELLTFYEDENLQKVSPQDLMYSSMQMICPCVRMHVKSTEFLAQVGGRSSQNRYLPSPKIDAKLDVGRCKVEVDMTLVDRIHAILNLQSSGMTTNTHTSTYFSTYQTAAQPEHSMFSQAIDDEDQHSRNQSVDFQLNCTFLTLDIRFPKVDLSSHRRVEMPWWQRSLHPEHLFLCLESTKFQTSINNTCHFKQFEITCRSGEGSFQLDGEDPTLFIRIGTDDLSSGDGFDWPRMMIRIFPEKQSVLEEVVREKEAPMESEYPVIPSEALPFSSKKAMYENKPLVMPGDRCDMMDFQDKSLGNTQLSIELSLPSIAAFLPNKTFFEIFYNRLLNDLLLWEPAAPIPMDTQEPHTFGYGGGWSPEFVPQMMQQGQIDATSYCTESTSESDGSEEFYPMDLKSRQQKRKASNDQRLQPSKMCLTLNVGKGSLTAYAPLKDEKNLVRKDAFGEFVFDVEESCFLAIVGHGGDPELQYICCQIHRATLLHSGQVEPHCSHPDLDYVMRSRYQHLERIFYLSDDGIPTRLRGQVGLGGDGQEDMLSLTIKVTSENFTNQKKYLIAAGLRGTTLRHLNTPSDLSWFDQITDFFNVADFDIPGYTLPKIVTEMHLYAWSCAIDYRPLYLPYKALVVFELFSFASNVIAETSTSTLRFLLDDAALYLSDKVSVERVDVKRDYVCVVDVGMFMLSVQMSNGEKAPKIDLIATNNIFNIRTCSDSFTALAELINYLANRGDLAEEEDVKPKCDSNTVSVVCSQPTSPQALTQTCMEHLPDLMADAMQDLPLSDHETSSVSESFDASDDVHHLYFQPTTGQAFSSSEPLLGRLSASLSSSSSSSSSRTSRKVVDSGKTPVKYSNSKCDMMDDEFCIIDEPGFGTKPRSGEPTVRILTQEPIAILDNHFHQPINKTDLLKAPEHFPPAVYRYTLKEISIIWHMFGGRDFESSPSSKLSTGSPLRVRKKNSNKDLPKDINWQARGGRGRDINTLMELHLNKVRVQHEVFPDSAAQVSRQVLLINEIEIRDRLAVSDINKFLYLYTSTDRPRQSHANMLVIKALHVRPDLMRPEEQECMLKVTLRPVRLNIDQDALSFLRTFSTEISCGRKTDDAAPSPAGGRPRSGEPPSSHTSTPKHILPTMGGLATAPATAAALEASQSLMTFDEIADAIARASEEVAAKEVQKEVRSEPQEKTAPIFFKSFVFTHEVLIHLDYHGKRVDMEQGTLTGLVVGLAQLKHSELRLKRLNMQCGLLGVDRLVTYAINEWLQDIKKNQLPSLLGGVGPMHSLVQLVQGCIDLFWLPVEQYRRDGRIVRGLQRGANSFMTCTAMSALELTNRVVMTVQFAAETAHDMVSPGPSVQKRKKTSKRRKGLTHPADLREGVANAYSIVKEGLCETASNIYVVAVEEHEHKGVAGAIGGIIRQFPSTVIKPLIFTTEATSNVLGGMRNQLHPEQRKEDEEKWKTSVDSI